MIYLILTLITMIVPAIVFFFQKHLAGFLGAINIIWALYFLGGLNDALAPNESGSVIIGMFAIFIVIPFIVNLVIISVYLIVRKIRK